MSPAEVGFAGVVGRLVTGPVRVGHHDLEVGPVEGQVVVAAIPEDDVGLFLGLGQDRAIVHSGIDDAARHDVGFVLLALLDRALVTVEVVHHREALHPLLD